MTDADLGELERLHAEFVAADAALRDARSRPGFWASPTYHLQRAYEETADAYQHALLRHGPALVAEVRRLRALDDEWYLAARKALADQLVTGLEPGWENIQPDTRDLYEVYRGRRHCDVPEPIVKLICDERDRLRAENDRLKRGDFTPDEFQALCHHLDGTGHCTRAAFEAGCRAYQDKLFGPPSASPAE